VHKAFDRSLYKLLTAAYPEFPWLPWKFSRPLDYWQDIEKAQLFIESIATKLNIKNISDWKNIKTEVKIQYCCFLIAKIASY
jgi:hypothetical protein